MIGVGLLIGAAIFGGYWLLDLLLFRGRVPTETMARGQSWLAWQMAPVGLACLAVALVVVTWEVLGTGPGDASGPYISGAIGLVAFAITRLWPLRLTPDPSLSLIHI